MQNSYYKYKKTDKTMWLEPGENEGEFLFTFDKVHIYNLFKDYPFNMTKQEVEIFSKEFPYWRKFFKERF